MGRPRKNKDAAFVVRKEPFDAESTVEGNALKEIARERAFDREEVKYEEIANLRDLLKSAVVVRNYPMAELKPLSIEPMDWGVTYFFPISRDETGKVAPTYVDEPKSKRQWEVCRKKAEYMKSKGYRYFILKGQDTINREVADRIVSGDSMVNESHVEAL